MSLNCWVTWMECKLEHFWWGEHCLNQFKCTLRKYSGVASLSESSLWLAPCGSLAPGLAGAPSVCLGCLRRKGGWSARICRLWQCSPTLQCGSLMFVCRVIMYHWSMSHPEIFHLHHAAVEKRELLVFYWAPSPPITSSSNTLALILVRTESEDFLRREVLSSPSQIHTVHSSTASVWMSVHA